MFFLILCLGFVAGAAGTVLATSGGGSSSGGDGESDHDGQGATGAGGGMKRGPAPKPLPERIIDHRGDRKPSERKPLPEQKPETAPQKHEESAVDMVAEEAANHLVSETLGQALGVDPSGIAVGIGLISLLASDPPPHRVPKRRGPSPAPRPRRRKREPGFSRDPDPF